MMWFQSGSPKRPVLRQGRLLRSLALMGALAALAPMTPAARAQDQAQEQTQNQAAPSGGSADIALLSLATQAPAPEAEGIGFYPLTALPAPEDMDRLVTATLLQSRAVSTIDASAPGGEQGFAPATAPGQIMLETRFALSGDDSTPLRLHQGDQDIAPEAFGPRIAALSAGFGGERATAGLAVVEDPQNLFPGQIGALRDALSDSGFALWVLLIAPGDTAPAGASCAAPLARDVTLALLGGLADGPSFGNGDGTTTFAEAETFLNRSLGRGLSREADCDGVYAVVFDHDGAGPEAPVLTHATPVYVPAQQSALALEAFEAEVLASSPDPAPIRAYLESCLYCPAAPALETRLTEIDRRAAQARIEEEIWTRIAAGAEDSARIQVYLDRCELCDHRPEAEQILARLAEKAAATEAEDRRYAELAASWDLAGLRAYVADCVTCAHVPAAQSRIAEIEANAAYDAEAQALDQAIAARDTKGIRDWIDSCTYCDRRAVAEAALDMLARRAELAAPCLRAAAVPQLGGPRRLTDIDQSAARAACQTALDAFPADPELATVMGRIAQAAGTPEAALAAYETGMEAGVPMAYGLAGYMHFDPPEGAGAPDYARAETLGRAGAELGNWMSQQLLVLLYTQGFVPGRGPDDALAIAEAVAAEGDPVSQYFLSFLLLNGDGPSGRPDPDAARGWLQQSVDAGYVPAMAMLAETLETAIATEPEAADLAAGLYLDAIREGDGLAREKLTTQLRERNRAVVRAVQSRLQDVGVYRGALDGLPGPGTINAIEAYGADTTN